jgi:hypothetical protein
LFYENSFIHFIDLGATKVNQFGLNETVVVVETKMSYWHMYTTHVLYTLNKGKLGSEEAPAFKDNAGSKRNQFKSFPKTRSFTTSTRNSQSNRVED